MMLTHILCFIIGFILGVNFDIREKEVLNEIQADKNRSPLTNDARMQLRNKVRR